MNTNAGLASGSRPYSVPALATWLNGMNLPYFRSLRFVCVPWVGGNLWMT